MEVHGSEEVITVSGGDLGAPVEITTQTDSSNWPRTRAVHEVTTKGNGAVRRRYGLRDNTFSLGGVYHNGAADTPRTVFEDNSSDVPFIITRRLEGTGSGLPEHTFNALLTSYAESSPVGDMVRWTAEFSGDGEVTIGTQA